MPLQLKQPIKTLAASWLVLMLYGCAATTPVQEQAPPQVTQESETVVATSDGKPALDPQIEDAFRKGLQAIGNKEYDKAIDIFYTMSQAHPNLSGAYANLGMLLTMQKDYGNAETALQQALRLNPDNPEIYNHMGLMYRQSGRFNNALQIYQQGLERIPDNDHLLRNTGILLDLYLNNTKEALEYYQRYLELHPDDKQVQIWIADLNQRIAP